MNKSIVSTAAAPAAIGPYSQAVKVGNVLYTSGQIGLEPKSMQLADGVEAQAKQAFANLQAVIEAAGASLDDTIKLTLYLTDLAHFSKVNDIMSQLFKQPYPARSTVGVASLPRGAEFEVEAIVALR